MTTDRKQGPEGAQGGQEQDIGALEPPNNANKQLQARRMRELLAKKYNQDHAAESAEFQKLTGVDPMNIAAVKKWQAVHNVTIDGKIGPATVQAAKGDKGDKGDKGASAGAPQADVSCSEEEANEDVDAKPESALGDALDGGKGGLKPNKHEGDLNEGDGLAADGVGKIAEDMADDHMEEGAAKTATGAVAARLLLVPRIVGLLRQHQYKEAVGVLKDSIGKEEWVEIAKLVTEKAAGGELPEVAARWFAGAAGAAAGLDALLLGLEWYKLGLDALDEARERGEKDSINSIFSWAYADTVLNGSHSNPGAISPEQIEAKEKGIQMGEAAVAGCPELPFLLKAEYGNGDNARHAIEDALMAKAGIHVRTHS